MPYYSNAFLHIWYRKSLIYKRNYLYLQEQDEAQKIDLGGNKAISWNYSPNSHQSYNRYFINEKK